MADTTPAPRLRPRCEITVGGKAYTVPVDSLTLAKIEEFCGKSFGAIIRAIGGGNEDVPQFGCIHGLLRAALVRASPDIDWTDELVAERVQPEEIKPALMALAGPLTEYAQRLSGEVAEAQSGKEPATNPAASPSAPS